MQIDELLHIAGDTTLKSFTWGGGVVKTLNSLFAEAQQLTVEITGNQALDILKALPAPALAGIMAIRIQVATGLPIDATAAPADTAPLEDDKKKSPVPLIIAGVTAFMAIVITIVLATTAVKTQTAPDQGTLHVVFNALIELLKLFMQNPPPPTPAA